MNRPVTSVVVGRSPSWDATLRPTSVAPLGRNLVWALSVAAGRCSPLMSLPDRQKARCDAARRPLHSNVDVMGSSIRIVAPLADTCTHVLLDAWQEVKRSWKATHDCGFISMPGLRVNRAIWVAATEVDGIQRWGDRAIPAAGLSAGDDQSVVRPCQEGSGRMVCVYTADAIMCN